MLQYVFNRNQPGDTLVLVHYNRHVAATFLESLQQGMQSHAFCHEQGVANGIEQVKLLIAIVVAVVEDVFGEQNPLDLVLGVFVNHWKS